ncbi:MAG: OmpH family outer membrane protein [Holosporaceae bacterium]|jgi:Skp family chaperone for outer membrane proteins|nr:OmpH family outer membrane protein [Holosporaceae bacterium]
MNVKRSFLGFAIFSLCVCFPSNALKNSNIKARVAVVDLKKVASRCKAGKDIEKQIVDINSKSKKDFEDLENKIKSREYVNSKSSDEDSRKTDEMRLVLYDMVRSERYKISSAYNKAISALDSEIKKNIKEVCESKGIALAVATDAVVYYDTEDCTDITDEVINKIDETSTSIGVDIGR